MKGKKRELLLFFIAILFLLGVMVVFFKLNSTWQRWIGIITAVIALKGVWLWFKADKVE